MIENKIKDLILNRYGSLNYFCNKIKLPYSTVDTILKRGIGKANVINVIKICNELGLSVDSLKDGILQPVETQKISRDNFTDQVEQLLRDSDFTEQQKKYIMNTINIVNDDTKK